jgi:16S rRNA (adenine1518-N6/adenine1519-N6)-dimethyltransferase
VGHQARKRFGQHFLVDDGVIARIVAAIDPRPGEPLVEIGPGLGALTRPLLRRDARLTVIEGDALAYDFAALAAERGARLRLVGNLPYNISTPLLFHLLDAADHIADQHFMLQKEVVDRMAAAPGNKDYGRLTVMLQWRYHIESLFDVPSAAFEPPPRVQSAVVRLLPWPQPAAVDASTLGALVTVAFSQRRKILRHTLGRWLAEHGFSGTFDEQRRAEEVPVAEYVALAQAVAPP